MRLLLVLPLLAVCSLSQAQEVSSSSLVRPEYKAEHAQEDWASLCNASSRKEYWDSWKCIPLSPNHRNNLSIGGMIRQRGEYFDHPVWGQEPPDNGYSLERYMLHADLHTASPFRFFTEFESGLEFGRDGGPRPAIDRNELFIHQTFVDVQLWKATEGNLCLRAGRQEMSFGASRLVGIREGPNVRQNFDGFRLTWYEANWNVDALATKFSESNPDVFDDSPNHAYSFWGLYATHPLFAVKGSSIDLYYLGTDKKKTVFQQGAAREQRETLGARVSGKRAHTDYDTEGTFQFGRFGSGNIRAWALATNIGYSFRPVSASLKTVRVAFEGGVASGDQNPNDHTLGTFNALFPKGAYFSEAELLGPYNIVHLRPNVKFELKHNISIWPDASFFWRQSTHDAIYAVPENLLRRTGASTASYIGSHANIELDWHPTQHFTYTLVYLHFFPGAFLKETQPDKDVNFVAPWITYNF